MNNRGLSKWQLFICSIPFQKLCYKLFTFAFISITKTAAYAFG